MLLRYLILCITSIAICGCAVNPNAPAQKPSTPVPTTATSSLIDIPISIQYAYLEETLNQAVPDILFWETGQVFECPRPIKKCTWQLGVRRNGRVTVAPTAAGKLLVKVPVETYGGRVDAEFFVTKSTRKEAKASRGEIDPEASTHADIYASVVIAPTIEMTLNPNWAINPGIALDIEVQAADVNFKGVTVHVRTVLRDAINKQKSKVESALVATVEKISFRPQVAQAWQALSGSYRVVDSPAAWVTLQPVRVRAENPKFTPVALKFGVGVEATLRTFEQTEKPDAPLPPPIPDLQIVPQVQGAYKLAVPIHISIASINKVLEPFIGRQFEFFIGDKKILAEVLEGRVYANGPDLVLYVRAIAPKVVAGVFSIKVGAFINGTPYFDTANRSVGLTDFDFDVNTNVLLLDKAAWFLHGKLKDEINKSLVFQVGGQLDTVKTSLAKVLAKVAVSDRISLAGTVDDLSVKTISVTGDYLSVDTEASGKLSAVIE